MNGMTALSQKGIYVFLRLFIFFDKWGECPTARSSEADSSGVHGVEEGACTFDYLFLFLDLYGDSRS